MLPLIYGDEHMAVFAKPSGLLVHRGWDNDREVAMSLARDALGRHVYPVHRLDRATSGALLFALDASCAAALGALFANGSVEKTYLAFVRGITPDAGRIDSPVPKTEGGPRVAAVTSFRRLHIFEQFSLVEARPETGRLHQIRRHLKHIGHPIVGDVNYGKGDVNRLFRQRFGLHRLALHALRLAFIHPVAGGPQSFTAPVPDNLREPFLRMGVPVTALEG